MAEGNLSEGQVNAHFKQLQEEHNNIAGKISELEADLHEHNLVIDAVSKLERERKCFRLIGGVLVERTVGEVEPAVVHNRDGIKDIIGQLQEQLQKKGTELSEFMAKYKIQGRRVEGGSENQEKKASGVLV